MDHAVNSLFMCLWRRIENTIGVECAIVDEESLTGKCSCSLLFVFRLLIAILLESCTD